MPKPSRHQDDSGEIYVKESLSTGIFEWQELAQVDFKELINLARQKSKLSEELETI